MKKFLKIMSYCVAALIILRITQMIIFGLHDEYKDYYLEKNID